MKVRYSLPQSLYAFVMALVVSATAMAQPHAQQFSPAGSTISFTENRGQIVSTLGDLRPEILYTAHAGGVKVFFRPSGVSYVFTRVNTPSPRRANGPDELPFSPDASTTITTYRMDMELVDANPNPTVSPEKQSEERTNYYSARFPNGITGVRSFGRLVYRDVYPNIDLVFYGEGSGMKYDFVVRPGGDVSDIRLRYVGADNIKATDEGTVVASNPLGTVEEGKIFSYQTGSSATQSVSASQSGVGSSYVLSNGVISFDIPDYDPTRPLVIDPPVMWSTYCGGSSNDITLSWNHGSNTVDKDRNVIITGSCASADFPVTAGAFQTNRMGTSFTYDTYVVKFSSNGNREWATYYGGGLSDNSYGVVTDGDKNVIFVGATSSFDFPVSQGSYRQGRTSANDGFIVKLDSNGKRIWATYYPNGQCFAVATDRSNNVLVGGTGWPKMPTTLGAFQSEINGKGTDCFIAKFSPSGSIIWSTFYGGSLATENIGSIATDSRSNVLVSGHTLSPDFPVSDNAFQLNIASASTDAFVIKLDSSGGRSWATFFGGGGVDYGYGIASDTYDNVVMTGYTASTDLPITGGAFQPRLAGGTDAYIVRFSTSGKRVWGSYFGGSSNDISYNIAIDGRSNVWVAGYTYSTNLPVSYDAYQSQLLGSFSSDAMVAQFDIYGNRVWATYLGGASNDYATGIATSHLGVVVTGTTLSSNLPVTDGAFQSTNAGSYDAFITQFCNVTATTIAVLGPRQFCQGGSTILQAPPGFQSYTWSNGQTGRQIVVKDAGRYYVNLGVGGCDGTTDPVEIIVNPLPRRVIGVIGSTRLCGNDSAILTVGDGLLSHRWSTGDTTASIVVREPGRYSVTFIDSNGCPGKTDTLEVTRHPKPMPVIAAEGPMEFCEGGSVVLDAGPGHSQYLWSGGEQTQRIVVARTGSYTVRVANDAGCWAESEPVTVTVRPVPVFKITPLLPTVFCHGDSTVLSSPEGFSSYRWSTGETGRTIVVRDAGKYTLTVANEYGCSSVASITVQIAPNPSPTIITSRPTRICVGETITLDAGDGYGSYLWSTGEVTQRIVVSEPGYYNVAVTNTLGCPGTSNTVQIEVVPKPKAGFSGVRSVCLNATATYTAPAVDGIIYDWDVSGAGGIITTGQGTSSITVRWGPAGIGTVRLTTRFPGSDCQADTVMTVAVGSSLMPTIVASGPLALCPGSEIVLDAGEGYQKYRWSTGDTTQMIIVAQAGNYSVTVTESGGCSGTSQPVAVKSVTPPSPTITPLGSTTFCVGGSVTLDAGAGYSEYLWSNGSRERRITVDKADEYFVTVLNSEGCMATSPSVQTVITSPPAPVISGVQAVCGGSRALYEAPQVVGHRYNWNLEGGTILSGQGGPVVLVEWKVDGLGTLDLTQEAPGGECIGSAPTFTVRIADTLQPMIAVAGSTTLCAGQTVVLDAGPGYESYLWSNGATDRSITVDQPGDYVVMVTGNGGCSGSSMPVTVAIKELPQPVIAAMGPTEFCEGESVTLRATAGFASYQWSNGATTQEITVSQGGTYTVLALDADGCGLVATEVAVTVHPRPTQPVIDEQSDWLLAPVASGYVWARDGKILAGETSQRILAREVGHYTVTVRNAAGCESVSEPFFRRIAAAKPRTVWIDTASVHVGNRFNLTMRVDPSISSADGIRGYRATIRIAPRSFFLHEIISPDRTTAGDAAVVKYEGNGRYVINRPATSQPLEGDGLFQIALEGLSTGVPVNEITIEEIEITGAEEPTIAGHGMVLLSGCDIGQELGFIKRVRLQSIRPNPVSHEAAIIYRAPTGVAPRLRLINTVGQEVLSTPLAAGTNEDQEARIGLNDIPSGVYTLELRDGNEISTLPLVIRK